LVKIKYSLFFNFIFKGDVIMKKNMIIFLLVLTTISLLGCATGSSPSLAPTIQSSSSQPVSTPISLKIGSLPRIFDLVLYAAKQDGVFQKNNLQVEIIPFRSVLERNTAFLAGQIDGFVDSIYEAINLNKDQENCRVIGHNLMPDMFEIVVTPASGITSLAQLKGKDIATSTATIMEYALDKLLAFQGVSSQDVQYVNVPNMPLRLEMMAQGKIPAAIMTPPLSALAIASGNKLLLDDTQQQLAGPGLIFSLESLKSKSVGVAAFVHTWQETVKIINSNPDSYRKLLISTAQVPEALAQTYRVPAFPEVRAPSNEELNMLIKWMQSKKMLSVDIPYDKIVTTQYLAN
jgi:NitT/TauT family transport system substrate-binding protein